MAANSAVCISRIEAEAAIVRYRNMYLNPHRQPRAPAMAANKLLLKALEDGDEAGYNRYGCPQLWVESVLPLVATT